MAQLAEQLTCNQQVFGSSPNIGFYICISRVCETQKMREGTQVAKGGRL